MDKNRILRYAKKIMALQKLGDCCIKCGEKNYFKLTFHHRESDEKEYKMTSAKTYRWSIYEKELDKCDLLCNNCHRELHYKNKITKDSRRDSKITYLNYSGFSCKKCGYDKCPASLTFHHRDPSKKDFMIGSLSKRVKDISELDDIIKVELDKCDVLCANCHIMEHYDLENIMNNYEKILDKIKTYKEKMSKINRNLVFEMYDSGMKQIEIVKYFKCSKGTISDIIKNRP